MGPDGSEIALLVMGSVALTLLGAKQYAVLLAVSRHSSIASTPFRAICRALYLAVEANLISIFKHIDARISDDYRRYRAVVWDLVVLTTVNVAMVIVIGVGAAMAMQQSTDETYIRPVDFGLISAFFIMFVSAIFAAERLKDDLTPSLASKLHEVSFTGSDGTTVYRRDHLVLSPRSGPQPTDAAAYPALSESERRMLGTDTESVAAELVAAGILDEQGNFRQEYSRGGT